MFLEVCEETWINTDNVFMVEGIGKMIYSSDYKNGRSEYYLRVYSDPKTYKDLQIASYDEIQRLESIIRSLK